MLPSLSSLFSTRRFWKAYVNNGGPYNGSQEQTLLNKVAESTVIFFPMLQLGCFKASATLASFSFSTGQSLQNKKKTKKRSN